MPTGVNGDVLEAGDRLGPYRVEAVLGVGTMGVVYRAAREPAGELVALKVMRPELAADDVFRRRFDREGEIASRLDHPHLVSVLDRGEAAGRPYLAARYVRGASLADRLAAGPLSAAELVRVVRHVASGLDALHALGLVHRDVKPSNVLLDERGRASLTDFGVARGAAHTVLTKQGRVVGTVDYLAPEVIRGEPAVPASDLYALGCVAYECAVGAPPFADRRTIAEVCIAHLRAEPADPTSARADLPSALTSALLTALAKDPAERPATGLAYARLLRAGTKGS